MKLCFLLYQPQENPGEKPSICSGSTGVALVHRVHLQKGSAPHSISRSTARKGSDRLKKRLFASPVPLPTALLVHPGPATSPQHPAAPSENRREVGDACAPRQTKILHQYCSYANRLGSCMWKIKRVVFTCTIKVTKTHNSPWAWFKACCYHWDSFHQFSEGFELGPYELNFQTASPWNRGLYIAQASYHLGAISLRFLNFVVVVELLMPKYWHLKNFST